MRSDFNNIRAGRTPLRRSGAIRAVGVLLALGLGGDALAQRTPSSPADLGPLPAADRRAPAVCLSDLEREAALRVGLVSLAPAPLCAPSYQVVEIRNEAPTPLADARLMLTPPLGEGRMRFTPLPGSTESDRRYVEISTDEGASWTRVDPPSGAGSLDDPLIFSSAQIPALRRLGAAGEEDDSVLVRWRATLGEKFGEPFASEALLGLSGLARDACGSTVRAPQRVARLSLDRPALIAGLEGRNVTRGGAFYRTVRAAPGDEIEWRAALENIGEAAAAVARVELVEEGGRGGSQVLELDGVVPGARRTTTLSMTAGEGCKARVFRLSPSWGCATPAAGAPAALSPLAEGYAAARLLREPDPNEITMGLKMTGEDGSPRPGDRAQVTVEIRNDGPPAFSPAVLVTLPDGYVPVRDRPVSLFATDSAIVEAVWGAPGGDKGREAAEYEALILLKGADGKDAALDPDAFAQLRFDVERVRRSALESDRLSAKTLFVSACGDAASSRPARLLVEPRQSDLTATLKPLDPPILAGPGGAVRFRATIANSGEEAAERLTASLTFGRSWSGRIPAPEICKPDGPPEERRFVCTVEDAARPGSSVSFEFDAVAGPEAGPPDYGLFEKAAAAFDVASSTDFSIVLSAAAYRGESAGPLAVDGPISQARAESGAIGFRLSQKLLDGAGAEWPLDRPIDLGEPVQIQVAAQWWGAGRERIAEPTLIQTLPRALAIQSAAGEQDGASVSAAVRGAQRQVLWGLREMVGAGRFTGRVSAVAVDPASADGRSDESLPTDPAEAASATAEADAVFSLRGEAYGVDALVSAATAAAPLQRIFRKPDLRLTLTLEGRKDGVGSAGARAPYSPGGALPVAAGERVSANLTLRNAGAAPGYVDWIEFEAPRFVTVLPLGADGLDNDGDGRVDEGDEAEAALRESRSGGVKLRWIRLPDGVGRRIGEARSRLSPGEEASFPVALSIDENLRPGAPLRLTLRSQFGARPFARRQMAGRAEIVANALLSAIPAEGALALTETRAAGAGPQGGGLSNLSRRVQHGAEVEHRAILRLPPGVHRGARLVVALPPAMAATTARALRKGHGVDCVGGAEARLEPVALGEIEEGRQEEAVKDAPSAGERKTGLALVWPLGDCTVDPSSAEEARTLLLDLVSVVRDADPDADDEALEAWRRPVLRSWFERSGGAFAAPGSVARPASAGRGDIERHALGRSALSLFGPLISATRVATTRPADSADGAAGGDGPRFDAGDRFEAVVEAVNRGDAPAEAVALRLLAPRPERGEAAALDCKSIAIETDAKGEFRPGESGCGGVAALSAALAPGRSTRFRISGRLRADAPIGRDGVYRAAFSAVGEGSIAARAGAAALPILSRSAPPPELAAVSTSAVTQGAPPSRPSANWAGAAPPDGGPDDGGVHRSPEAPVADLAIGDALLLRADHFLPEGSGEASLSFRLRIVEADGEPLGGALPEMRLIEASTERAAADLSLGADPGRLNDRPQGVRAPITGAVTQRTDIEGWRRFTLPLGALKRARVVDGSADANVDFEAVVAFEDAPALRAGLMIEAEALTEIAGAPISVTRRVVARLAEPALSIAARAEAEGGAVRLGGSAQFFADICNGGAAPAYALTVEGALPPGFSLDRARPLRFVLAPPTPAQAQKLMLGGVLTPRQAGGGAAGGAGGERYATADAVGGFGVVTASAPRGAEDGVRLTAKAAPGAALGPGRCARIEAAARATASAGQSLAAARFAIASYASRPGDGEAGRRYLGGPAGRSALQTLALSIEAAREAEVAPGARTVRRFRLSAPEAVEAMRVSLSVEGAADLGWTLWRDADENGALDENDPPWRNEAVLAQGRAITVFAVARVPLKLAPRWRRIASLKAAGVGASGRVAAGLAEFSVRAREERLGALKTSRLMAVDRDCDGDLADETAQDAAFEAGKDAAPGECVTMRLLFSNTGGTAVESVSIEDRPPRGLMYQPGGARLVEAPAGLIAGQIQEPGEAEGEASAPDAGAVRFDFVGALAPDAAVIVEYRVRLPAE